MTIQEGFAEGDPALICAVATLAVTRAGKAERKQMRQTFDMPGRGALR